MIGGVTNQRIVIKLVILCLSITYYIDTRDIMYVGEHQGLGIYARGAVMRDGPQECACVIPGTRRECVSITLIDVHV